MDQPHKDLLVKKCSKFCIFFSRVELRRQWEPSTTNWYMSQLKVFLDYCHTYEKRQMKKEFCLPSMQKALRDARRKFAPNLARCSKENKKDKFSRVPSLQQVTKRQQQVIEVLERDLEEKNLTTTTLKALNFFLLQCRLNVRPGPILNVTWECFDSHLKAGHVYETSDHKTGKFYDVAVRIEADQIAFLDELRERMKSEYPTMPSLMFANTKSQQETKMSYLISDTFTELFQDDPNLVRYNANSIRKFWEMYMAGLELSQNHKDAHLAQTAHSETTARKHYQSKYIEYFLSTWICGWIYSCFEHF